MQRNDGWEREGIGGKNTDDRLSRSTLRRLEHAKTMRHRASKGESVCVMTKSPTSLDYPLIEIKLHRNLPL